MTSIDLSGPLTWGCSEIAKNAGNSHMCSHLGKTCSFTEAPFLVEGPELGEERLGEGGHQQVWPAPLHDQRRAEVRVLPQAGRDRKRADQGFPGHGAAQLGWKTPSASLGKGWGHEEEAEVQPGLMLKFPVFTLWCQRNPSSPTPVQGHLHGKNNITRHQD